ncbi:hypothetical protein [Lolliginicoccus levis]|uniref:hypothetical protein n=1 Tax=Lolliginicoccus levis TaxID=2919542 RepID=UPI00241FEEB2|nr:hypothetical protein [Lolliginicoccus levis]
MPLGVGVSRSSGAPVPTGPITRAVPVLAGVVLAVTVVTLLGGWVSALLLLLVLGVLMLLRVSGADLAWQRVRAWRARMALRTASKQRRPGP